MDVARAGQLTTVAREPDGRRPDPCADASSAHVPPLTVGVVTTESPAWIAAALESSAA